MENIANRNGAPTGKEPSGFMLYRETAQMILAMTADDSKDMLSAMCDYAFKHVSPEFESGKMHAVIWPMVKRQIDADQQRYAEKCAARAEAGRRGGLKKAENARTENGPLTGSPPGSDIERDRAYTEAEKKTIALQKLVNYPNNCDPF